jgi:hypothetical protein
MKKFLTLIAILAFASAVFAGGESPHLSEKDVLGALMKNLDIQLTDAAHCEGVGVEVSDQTIGGYLSGFWAFHANATGRNWIEVTATKIGSGWYLAKVMIYRKDDEENWGWGVSFELDASKHVKRDSFTCLGAG